MESFSLAPISAWKTTDAPQFCLGCDVGGSGLRVRLSSFFNTAQFIDMPHIKAQCTAEMLEALDGVYERIQAAAPGAVCRGASIAVAGPISNNSVVFTNWLGKPALRTVSIDQLPKKLFPEGKTMFLNDLEAGAYGVIAASEQGSLEPVFEQLFTKVAPKGKLISDSRTAVLAMGSGLGVALVLKTPLINQPLVLPTELGHLQVPTVCQKHQDSEEEYRMVQFVSEHYYNGRQMPEFEDISSGRGLCLVYQYYYDKEHQEMIPLDQIDAGEIAQLAKNGDKIARQALLIHYQMFIRICKAVATTLSCDSILMALDNQVKNTWFVRSVVDELQEEFYTFIRPDWMKNVRIYTQTKELNFNLLGTDYMAHQLSTK